VVLETVFVELTQSGARNLGLDFNNPNGQLATAAYSLVRGDFPGFANTTRGGGFAFGLQAAIYAQIDKGEGRIISKPRIAAQSGSMAKIVTGDALPILTSIALSGVNAVQQQVQYVNVGVTLQIAPRVSDDGFVTSHVFAVVSSVTGFSQGYPTISQREASTSATVRDGDSFVIGGLTQEADLSHHIKLPGIGDVPVLGRLFDTQHSSRAKTDLYIVVTPHVVRSHDPVDANSGRPPGAR
jgi:general secretion pathway protein D